METKAHETSGSGHLVVSREEWLEKRLAVSGTLAALFLVAFRVIKSHRITKP
jgi:hypothetical protein